MFAPPPTATLSRAEIQSRRAQLQAKRASSTGGTSISSASELQRVESSTSATTTGQALTSPKLDKDKDRKEKKSGRFSSKGRDVEEIREADREAWKFKNFGSLKGNASGKEKGKGKGKGSEKNFRLGSGFGAGVGVGAGAGGSMSSLPATLLPPPPVPPGPPSLRTTGAGGSDAGSLADSVREEGSGGGNGGAAGFANSFASPSPTERARRPPPPKRPARPSGEFLSPPLSSSMSDSFPRALTPESMGGSSFRSASSSPATPPPFQTPPPIPGVFPMPMMPMSGSPKPPPLPSPPLAKSPGSSFGPSSPPPSTPPPPVPEKSPLRQQRATRPTSNPVRPTTQRPAVPKKQHTMSTDAALSAAMAELKAAMKDPISIGSSPAGEQPRPPYRSRAATAPAEMSVSVLTGIQPLQVRKRGTSSSRSGTGSSSRVEGSSSSAAGIVPVGKSQRVAKQGLKRQAVTHHRRGSSAASVRLAAKKAKTGGGAPLLSPKPKRARKGEALAMLQTTDMFSSAGRGVVYNPKNPNVQVKIPSPRSFIDKDLPDTPNSIAPTPTELYQPSRSSLIAARKHRLSGGSAKRSPLSVITDVDARSNNSATPPPTSALDDISPHRLTTILEYKPLSENSPPPSGTATPVATQIHLRGGSVVTVTPPELTAWQRSIYIQGPIRLPKPVILPRKNSVASMEPFQEAIDRVYQNALFVPRRRSDDAIVDDICEFFDDFGFGDFDFEGGLLAVQQADDAEEVEEMEVDELDETLERFITPPGSPPAGDISPIERVVAKDVIEASMATNVIPIFVPEPSVPLPPAENEEALRARGIARLSQLSAGRSSQTSRSSSYRKETPSISRRTSDTIGQDGHDGALPLLPAPEASMLDAVMEASEGEEDEWTRGRTSPDGDAGGMDWSDDSDVEETVANASWTAPAVKSKKHALDRGLVGRERRNPVAKMRRFVATATTIL